MVPDTTALGRAARAAAAVQDCGNPDAADGCLSATLEPEWTSWRIGPDGKAVYSAGEPNE